MTVGHLGWGPLQGWPMTEWTSNSHSLTVACSLGGGVHCGANRCLRGTTTHWWSTVASLRWAKGPLWQQPMAEPDHEWSQVTNGQGVMMHAHSHVLRATHCHALLHYLCTLYRSCCILWSILQSTFTITTTSTHTHTHDTCTKHTNTKQPRF